ncbi:MAG: hypothetical protein FJ135_06095 [Deltaproteobacteria bacterium]|nr:hypothetical protein [Deltaproteobacteria bacterium]
MTEVSVEKVPGGYRVDGLVLLGGKCGCGGLTGAGDCCQTYSVVRKDNNLISFFAKGTTANTSDNFKSGYRVKKGDIQVEVIFFDTKSPKKFTFGGHYPPPLSAWQEKGWQVLQAVEESLEGTGMELPEWCQNAESCERPASILSSPAVE